MEEYVLKPILAKVFQEGDEDGFAENFPIEVLTPYIDTYDGRIRTFGKFNEDVIFINADGERELMNKDKFERMYERADN